MTVWRCSERNSSKELLVLAVMQRLMRLIRLLCLLCIYDWPNGAVGANTSATSQGSRTNFWQPNSRTGSLGCWWDGSWIGLFLWGRLLLPHLYSLLWSQILGNGCETNLRENTEVYSDIWSFWHMKNGAVENACNQLTFRLYNPHISHGEPPLRYSPKYIWF